MTLSSLTASIQSAMFSFVKFGINQPLLFFWISKISKNELGKCIPNFSQKHVITSTNFPVILGFAT